MNNNNNNNTVLKRSSLVDTSNSTKRSKSNDKHAIKVHEFDFLREPMDKHIKLLQAKKALEATHAATSPFVVLADTKDDNKLDFKAEMNVPKPVTADVKGDMDKETFDKTSFTHTVCQNMIQQTIVKNATKLGVPAAEALKNMELWVQGYSTFPFPFYNLQDTQNQTYKKDDFSLTADPEVVEQIVNIKGVDDLKTAVVGAIKTNNGDIVKYSKQDKDFNYFGIITGYKETGIEVRLVKFQMHMKQTDTKVLCGQVGKTSLDSKYNTYSFTADKYMLEKMQESLTGHLVDVLAAKLFEFAKMFYEEALENWGSDMSDSIKKMLKDA